MVNCTWSMITSITLIIHSFISSKSRFFFSALALLCPWLLSIFFSFSLSIDCRSASWGFCCHWIIFQIFIHNNQHFGYFYWVAIILLIVIILMKFFLVWRQKKKRNIWLFVVFVYVLCFRLMFVAFCLPLNVNKQYSQPRALGINRCFALSIVWKTIWFN